MSASATRARVYPSDMSDAEWAVIEPLLPAPGWTLGRGGSPGSYCRRDIVNAIRYLVHNGPVWRALPVTWPWADSIAAAWTPISALPQPP